MLSFSFKTILISSVLLAAPAVSSVVGRAQAANSAGCGKSHTPGYYGANDGNHQIQSSGDTRKYGMYVPADGTPDGQHENSQYYKYPKASEYLVAYPLGKKGAEDKNAWQSAPYAALGVNDLQFASDLVDHISNNYCVDTGRIYASGKSNGGGFVDFLACSNVGDRFAAFAMAAPALYSDNAQTACPMKLRKIIHAHGLEDDTIPYDGGPSNGGQLPKIVDWLQWWANRGQCISKQGPVQSNGYKSIVYTSCAGGVTNAIKHYGVDKGGHCWPDDKSDNTDGARSDCKDQSLDFTMMVLDFFNARSL